MIIANHSSPDPASIEVSIRLIVSDRNVEQVYSAKWEKGGAVRDASATPPGPVSADRTVRHRQCGVTAQVEVVADTAPVTSGAVSTHRAANDGQSVRGTIAESAACGCSVSTYRAIDDRQGAIIRDATTARVRDAIPNGDSAEF